MNKTKEYGLEIAVVDFQNPPLDVQRAIVEFDISDRARCDYIRYIT